MYDELNNYIGQELTYKNMTEILGMKYYKGGSSKIRQLKEIQCYYKLKKKKNKYKIIKKYETPLKRENARENGNNTKYKWLQDEKYLRHGVYYIVDEFNNIYIGSTRVSFKSRLRSHLSTNNACESKYVVCNNYHFGILFDMTDIEDDELIRKIETIYIEYFKSLNKYNVVNTKIERCNIPIKYKNIKVKENEYFKAIEILINNGISIKDK